MKTINFYNRNQFFEFKKKVIADGSEIISMSQFLSSKKIEDMDSQQKYYVDLSSMVGFMKANEAQIMSFEQLLNQFASNVTFICDKVYEVEILYSLRYVFDESKDIEVEINDKNEEAKVYNKMGLNQVKKITELSESELTDFFTSFDSRLYGHEAFKKEFKELVTSFRVFNKIGEHKILSLLLMGDSGFGKTEVARAIHKALGSKAKLAKINFGNYSSHDALNSLIGSPLGYIGSDGGELVKRMQEADIGLILIDEFEKADDAVFNYFLDVLENGKVVNSQAEEFDVDGYIIVFTSNISKENFKNRISPELRSRFDYKGIFNILYDEDKNKLVHFRINEITEKYNKFVSSDIPEKLHEKIASKIYVSKYKNMRELNKKIKDVFVEEIKK